MAFLFDFKLLQCFCIICKGGQNVLISKNHLHKNTENIAGKLTFYQMDGNSTYVRNTGELASDVPTETMFELFDPLQNFSSAKFSYTWDLGNGYSPPYWVFLGLFPSAFRNDWHCLFIPDVEKWYRALSLSSATFTHTQETTHCSWKLESILTNLHRKLLRFTPLISKSWVSSSVYFLFL